MRILLRRLVSPDPATFGVAFAAWAAILGISLIIPGNAFDLSPAWASLQVLYASDEEWGWVMLVDCLLLIIGLRMKRIPQRAAINVFSSVMWALLGTSMVVNAWHAGFLSVVGAYSVWCSLQCLLTVGKWLFEEPAHGSR